jgi:hypothetical protein
MLESESLNLPEVVLEDFVALVLAVYDRFQRIDGVAVQKTESGCFFTAQEIS